MAMSFLELATTIEDTLSPSQHESANWPEAQTILLGYRQFGRQVTIHMSPSPFEKNQSLSSHLQH